MPEKKEIKCNKCVFYNKDGYIENNFKISTCKYILEREKQKKEKKQKYDLFKSLIYNEEKAKKCIYYAEIEDIIKIISREVIIIEKIKEIIKEEER